MSTDENLRTLNFCEMAGQISFTNFHKTNKSRPEVPVFLCETSRVWRGKD